MIFDRGDYYASGVGILIHSSLVKFIQSVHRKNDRIMAVDMEISGKRFRILAVYLPHSGFGHIFLEECYRELSDFIREARDKCMYVIVGAILILNVLLESVVCYYFNYVKSLI